MNQRSPPRRASTASSCLFAPEAPSGILWSRLYAGITEVGVDGYQVRGRPLPEPGSTPCRIG